MTTRKEQKELTKKKIYDAAKKLFYINGYNKTSMRMIAKEGNVSLSLLPYHYKTKEIIATEILLNQMKAANSALIDSFDSTRSKLSFFVATTWIGYIIFRNDKKTSQLYTEVLIEDIFNKYLYRFSDWYLRLLDIEDNYRSENEIRIAITIANATERSLTISQSSGSIDISNDGIFNEFILAIFNSSNIQKKLIFEELIYAKELTETIYNDHPEVFSLKG